MCRNSRSPRVPFCWQVSDHPPSPGGWVPVPGTVTKKLVAQSGSGSKYSALASALVLTYYLDPSNLAKYCISSRGSATLLVSVVDPDPYSAVFRIRVFFRIRIRLIFSESGSGSDKDPDPIRKNPDPGPWKKRPKTLLIVVKKIIFHIYHLKQCLFWSGLRLLLNLIKTII